MTDSILNNIKLALGISEDYEPFDFQIMLHINSVLSNLTQLGIGPEAGFRIEGTEETWADFLDDDNALNMVKTYMYLRVRLLFDPPTTGFTTTAIQDQIKEQEWRINVYREGKAWVPADNFEDVDEIVIVDGGGP